MRAPPGTPASVIASSLDYKGRKVTNRNGAARSSHPARPVEGAEFTPAGATSAPDGTEKLDEVLLDHGGARARSPRCTRPPAAPGSGCATARASASRCRSATASSRRRRRAPRARSRRRCRRSRCAPTRSPARRGQQHHPHLRAHHAQGQERPLDLARGVFLHRPEKSRDKTAPPFANIVPLRTAMSRSLLDAARRELLLDRVLVEARRRGRAISAGRSPATRWRTRRCRWWSRSPACGCARRSPRPSARGVELLHLHR
jgi:hypothetical protein